METPPEMPGGSPEESNQQPPRLVPWRGWEALLVYVISLVVAAPLTFVGVSSLSDNAGIAFTAAATEGVLLLSVVAYVRLRHRGGIDLLGWRTDDVKADVKAGLWTGVAGIALQFLLLPPVLYIARELLNREVEPPDQLPLDAPGPALLAFIGIVVVILAPVAEEMFFRGFLFQAYRKWMSLVAAGATSAVFFAVAHISPLLYLPIGALGYLLARVFERRGSLLSAIVAHAAFNAFGFTVIVVSL